MPSVTLIFDVPQLRKIDRIALDEGFKTRSVTIRHLIAEALKARER